MSSACELETPKPAAEASVARRRGTPLPAAIVVGGGANALSVARSLGRSGVTVYALNEPTAHVRYSRYARWVDVPADAEAQAAWLLGPASEPLRGSVLLAAGDAAIELIAEHRDELAQKFLLDLSNCAAQRTMLNKLDTYRAAVAAGVPTPRFWLATTLSQLDALRGSLVFPLIVKPRLSHVFEERFGRKFLVAESHEQLVEAFRVVQDADIETMLVERIPGGDDHLCSYYTYLDDAGTPLFDFTKRIIRRWPVGMGGACYHITDHVPEVRELGLKLFQHVGLRGLANVEFKLDPRDGQLKLIECNARFTAANGLLADCGFDLARLVYNRLVGLEPPQLAYRRRGVRLWYPIDDFKSFCELRQRGELTLAGWLASLCHRQTFPFFRWRDPLPTLMVEARRLGRGLRRLARRR
ncbi:MAG TPA: hypothetical protein VFW87_10785 [Pirellulales bacterium]|nr:hypothetical protein [Pirellulales bacterium]